MKLLIHEFDPSGSNPNNLVVEENHNITNTTGILTVAQAGLFYTKSLVVRKVLTNQILILGTDYRLQGFDPDVTAITGFECASAITFVDITLRGNVTLTYQAVGGKEGEITGLLFDLRKRIALLASGNVTWADVLDKPATYPPESHVHNVLTSLTGLNAVTAALEKIVSALTNTRIPTLSGTKLNNRIDRLLAILTKQRTDITNVSSLINDRLSKLTSLYINSSIQLDNNIGGKTIFFTTTTNKTVVLPLLSTVADDIKVEFLNTATGLILLTAAGTDTIKGFNSSNAVVQNPNVLFSECDNLILVKRDNLWYKLSGTVLL
jgi:hypothetical protein